MNNKVKLYTEEQVKRAISLTLDSPTHSNLVLDHLTPIELPSDKKIENDAEQFEYTDGIYGFKQGVKWIIDKLKNQ